MELNKKQRKAIEKLEKAFKECKKNKVFLLSYYGDIIAYDGTIVKSVDDNEKNDGWYKSISNHSDDDLGYTVEVHGYDFDSWADDEVFIHLSKKELKKRDQI